MFEDMPFPTSAPCSTWMGKEMWKTEIDEEELRLIKEQSMAWNEGMDIESGMKIKQNTFVEAIKESTPFTWYIIGWMMCFLYSASGYTFNIHYPMGLYITYLLTRLIQVINKERQYPIHRTWEETLDSGFIRFAAALIHFRNKLEQLAIEEEDEGGEDWIVDAWRGVL